MAAAAKTKAQLSRYCNKDSLQRDLKTLQISTDPFEPSIKDIIPLTGHHPTLGLIVINHPDMTGTVQVESSPGTVSAETIRQYKSRLRGSGSIIRYLNDDSITNADLPTKLIQTCRDHGHQNISVQFSRPTWLNISGEGIPVIQFDQLNVIAHHIHHIKYGEDLLPDDCTHWPSISPETIFAAINKGMALPKLTRRKLLQDPSWPKFQKSEYCQLDKYYNQGMFGDPIPQPRHANTAILNWISTYLWKLHPLTLNKTAKSRGTCNGEMHFGQVVTLAETYAACVVRPAHQLCWALTTALNYVALGVDVALTKNPSHQDESFQSSETSRDIRKHHDSGTSTSTRY